MAFYLPKVFKLLSTKTHLKPYPFAPATTGSRTRLIQAAKNKQPSFPLHISNRMATNITSKTLPKNYLSQPTSPFHSFVTPNTKLKDQAQETDSDDAHHFSEALSMEEDGTLEDPYVTEESGDYPLPLDVSEDENGMYLRVDMPGVAKEKVKLLVDMNVVNIKGEEAIDIENPRKYLGWFVLDDGLFKMDNIRAVMKDGVLRIVVPKMKLEEKSGVFAVPVN